MPWIEPALCVVHKVIPWPLIQPQCVVKDVVFRLHIWLACHLLVICNFFLKKNPPSFYFFPATWLKLSNTLSFRSPLFSWANSSVGVSADGVELSVTLLEEEGEVSCLDRTFA